jgi:hypothetical protein
MAGKRFGRDVRHVLLRLLAPAGHGADPLTHPHQRVDDERRGGHAHQRQLGIVVEQQAGIADERQRLAREVTDGFRDSPLHLPDVVVDARQQLPGGARGEEGRRLIQQVTEQIAPDLPDDTLADVVHQVAGKVGAQSLEKVGDEKRRDDESQPVLRRQHIVHDRLDQPRERG